MSTVPRICIRRTLAVDDLLTEIWDLRPELKCKNTTTLLLGLESFLRECQIRAHSGFLPPSEDTSLLGSETVVAVGVSAAKKDSTVSDDIEW